MTSKKMTRSLEVDTVRGIACILLVLFHVVGDTPAVGLKVPEGHWLQVFNEGLAYIRMPLFSFISGYVYAFRPFQGNAPEFIKGKVRRLLLPLLTVGTLFAIVQALTPGANSSVTQWWLLHIEPVGHFWFLEALFIVFLVVLLLEHLNALSTASRFALVWVASAVLFDYFSPPNYFAARGAVYLLPFFLAGLACKRFNIGTPRARLVAAAAFICAATAAMLFPQFSEQGSSMAALALGVSSAFLLLRSGWSFPPLAYIGSFSFAIYLLHVFFTAASRIIFRKLGVTDTYVLMMLGLTAGVAGPVVSALLINRHAGLSLWLLGTVPAKAKVSTQTVAA
ncbi:MAG: acyltransferase [Polaromonas sp.]|uniref:acyltransferase family protein n=1 Tax=Polaromonas sp. TaxID=1869339 RepID=UPI0032638394